MPYKPVAQAINHNFNLEKSMGKYFIGWLLGVPVVVLVIFFLFF